jgi:hypothetical protein
MALLAFVLLAAPTLALLAAPVFAQSTQAPDEPPVYQQVWENFRNPNTPQELNYEFYALADQYGTCDAAPSAQLLGQEFVANSGLVLLLMTFATGILYMAGSFLNDPKTTATAKAELYEILLGALIVVAFYVYFVSAAAVQGIFGIDLFTAATDYSKAMLYRTSNYLSFMTLSNIALNMLYTIYVPLGPIRMNVSFQLGPALRPAVDVVSYSAQFLVTAYGEWAVFSFLFCFIKKWMLSLFFPAGLLLRAFPQTRGGGNVLIALAIALCTLYPLLFYIDYNIFNDRYGADPSSIPSMFFKTVQGFFTDMDITAVITGVAVAVLLNAPFWTMIATTITKLALETVFDVIGFLVVFSLVLPIFNIFITITFAREISRLLGTEISLAAFTKLI